MIEENVVCKHCSEMQDKMRMDYFFEYARRNSELSVREAWLQFIRKRARFNIPSTNQSVAVQLSQETHGLATRLNLT